MPLKPADQQRRDQLTEAAATLRAANRPDLADAVDYVLTPDGWGFVNRLMWGRKESATGNMPIRVDPSVRDHLKASSANLTGDVNEGFEKFLAGEWVPDKPEPAGPGSAVKVVLNVRPDEALSTQVKERCEQLRSDGELGWKPYASTVALAYLVHKHGLPAPEVPAE